MPSEFDFVERIRQQVSKQSATAGDLVFGIGDDAAIWREQAGRETLVTVDLLVEDVDFKLEYAPPRWLGHKALAVSLSDIAAMGGAPKFSLLTLAIPPSLKAAGPEGFWEDFFAGYFALAEAHGVQLIGGDISSAPDRLTMDSIVIGHCAAGKAVRRDGAKIGDAVYVTGSLGASAAGLRLLLQGERVEERFRSSGFSRSSAGKVQPPEGGTTNLIQSAIRSHLRPEPRVEFGRRIGAVSIGNAMPTAMIDVSDGLVQDLAHICEASRAGAVLDFDAVPVAAEVKLVTANADGAFELAVSSGEDFELLLTAHRKDEEALLDLAASCQLSLTRIGEVVPADPAATVWLRRDGDVKPLSIRGYDHFAASH